MASKRRSNRRTVKPVTEAAADSEHKRAARFVHTMREVFGEDAVLDFALPNQIEEA